MKVRCNWCMSEFDESKLIIKNDAEFCPVCDKSGYIMDLEEEGGED